MGAPWFARTLRLPGRAHCDLDGTDWLDLLFHCAVSLEAVTGSSGHIYTLPYWYDVSSTIYQSLHRAVWTCAHPSYRQNETATQWAAASAVYLAELSRIEPVCPVRCTMIAVVPPRVRVRLRRTQRQGRTARCIRSCSQVQRSEPCAEADPVLVGARVWVQGRVGRCRPS